jgi:hypothetical protein
MRQYGPNFGLVPEKGRMYYAFAVETTPAEGTRLTRSRELAPLPNTEVIV